MLNKGINWIFIIVGGETKKKKTKTFDVIGQALVTGAIHDTKKIRKAGADMFPNSEPGQPDQKTEKGKHKKRKRNPNTPENLRIPDNHDLGKP